MIHECQADHIGNFPLWFVVWQWLQFLHLNHIAASGEHAVFRLAHLLADFGKVEKIIYTVRQIVQLRQEIIIRIEFPQFLVCMHIYKHLTAVRVVCQRQQLLRGDDPAVFLDVLLFLHLQKSFQRCFLPCT